MKKKYSVTGMTCAACSSGIERTVSKLKGVETCSVSLMGESMEVSFDESVVSDARIKSAVSALGYGAYDFGAVPEKKKKKFTLGVRFVLSLILLIPEMYLSMGHMMGIPVPHGWLNYGFQVGLTLLILLINGQFFVSGVRAAVKLVPNMDTLVTLGAAVSFAYSLVMAILTPEEPTLFFESAAMIVTLVTLGKWLEDKSKKIRASAARGGRSKNSAALRPIPSPSSGRGKRRRSRLRTWRRAIRSSSNRANPSPWTAL